MSEKSKPSIWREPIFLAVVGVFIVNAILLVVHLTKESKNPLVCFRNQVYEERANGTLVPVRVSEEVLKCQ